MASPQRIRRVAEQMKKEIASILEKELKDPRKGFVTVTSVELSNDLKHGKIFVSILGDEDQKKESMEILQKAVGFVRKELGERIKLRYVPEIQFKFDDSIEHGAKIARILSDIKKD